MQIKRQLIVATVLLSVLATQAQFVYDNSTFDLDTRFRVDNGQVGDEIVLDGTSRQLTTFSFQYYGVNLSGDETARLVLYENNGPLWGGSAITREPFSILYDSGASPSWKPTARP